MESILKTNLTARSASVIKIKKGKIDSALIKAENTHLKTGMPVAVEFNGTTIKSSQIKDMLIL